MDLNWNQKIEKYFLEKPGFIVGEQGERVLKKKLYTDIINQKEKLRKLKLKIGYPILLYAGNTIEFLVQLFSLLSLGAVPVLLPSNIIPEELSHFPILLRDKYISAKTNKMYYSKSSFFLFTSGTTGIKKIVGINLENLDKIFTTHLPFLNYYTGISLSSLPYYHIFGLVMDIFITLELGLDIIRTTPNKILLDISALQNDKKFYILNGVPLQFSNLIKIDKNFIKYCSGGIVGGASIPKKICNFLKKSELRVGYGQTEASPGILLGDAGQFYPSFLGRYVGIEVKIDPDGQLLFRGENAFRESLDSSGIVELERDRWVETGDLVERKSQGYFYRGRKVFFFKLSNGRMFYPENMEQYYLNTHGMEVVFLNYQSELIILTTGPEWKVQKYLPEYLRREKFRILRVFEWSKDRKGSPDRKLILSNLDLES